MMKEPEEIVESLQKDKKHAAILWGIVVLLLLLLTVVGVVLLQRNQTLEQRQDKVEQQASRAESARGLLAKDVTALRKELLKQGVPADKVDAIAPAAPSPLPEVQIVESAPTTAQVQTAVRAVLQQFPSLTRAEIADKVFSYLKANPPQNGADGSSGAAGQPGVAGQPGTEGADGVPGPVGPAGPGPTDTQVASAVADYCKVNNCKGSDGEDGAQGSTGSAGAPGKDGRGVASVQCSALVTGTTLTFTYSDGTTEAVSCDNAVQPTEGGTP